MPTLTRLFIALCLAPATACGGGYQLGDAGQGNSDSDPDASGEATKVGCDSLEYEGVQFDAVGCATGEAFVNRTLQRDGTSVEVVVTCVGGCIDSIFVNGGGSSSTGGPGTLGSPCESAADCVQGFSCDAEIQVMSTIEGLPNGVPSVLKLLFPNGSCTPIAFTSRTDSSSCDPFAPLPEQGCGSDGTCVPEPGFTEQVVACRRQCEPSSDESGCEEKFFTCDFSVEACVEGCQSDEECRAQLIDGDGDGIGDALAYDEVSDAFCDETTRRCSHPGVGGETGDACVRLDDCEPDGLCLTEYQSFGGFIFPAGSCTKTGCYVEGRECVGDDSLCTTVRTWNGSETQLEGCFTACTVGADAKGEITGKDGHGEGCRPGYRCHYNGADRGICVGGQYNDVAENNVGDLCELVDECYSGYGLASCITLAVGSLVATSGMCTLLDCAAPGLPDDICGEGNACILLSDDMTFCVKGCEAADDCGDGFACMDDDGDPGTGKVCFPVCAEDGDCRDGQRCDRLRGETLGQCLEI